MEKKITVYTDGGCSGNPGPGGWAYVVLENDTMLSYASGNVEDTTNNRMELIAVINALETCIKSAYPEITLFTDSQYVKNGYTTWLSNWKRNGWKSSTGAVKNKDLWVRLDNLSNSIKVNFCWVRGHNGEKYNEMCDSLVKDEIKKLLK